MLDLGVIDGNRDGNVRSQPQAAAAMDSQTLLLNWAELAIRYTWKTDGRATVAEQQAIGEAAQNM